MIGSLRICATPETMVGRGESPSPSKGDRRIPFISVGDGRGDDWPQQVSISKEAQEFIAQIEGPVCVLACMGSKEVDKVSSGAGVVSVCSLRVPVVCAWLRAGCLCLPCAFQLPVLTRQGRRRGAAAGT
jgi:hypothetical protein